MDSETFEGDIEKHHKAEWVNKRKKKKKHKQISKADTLTKEVDFASYHIDRNRQCRAIRVSCPSIVHEGCGQLRTQIDGSGVRNLL